MAPAARNVSSPAVSAGVQPNLFADQPAMAAALAPFQVPEVGTWVWANTTVRNLLNAIPRMLAILEGVSDLTLATCPSKDDLHSVLANRIQAKEGTSVPPSSDVIAKTLGMMVMLGMCSVNTPALRTDRWVFKYQAADAVLTDPDTQGMLAFQLLAAVSQPQPSIKHVRPFFALLNLFSELAEAGICDVRADEIVVLSYGSNRERKWRPVVERFIRHRASGRQLGHADFVSVMDPAAVAFQQQQIADVVAAAVTDGLSNVADVTGRFADSIGRLLPKVRRSSVRVRKVTEDAADLFISDNLPAVRALFWDDFVRAKADSACDFVATASRYMVAAGMLEEVPGSRGKGSLTFNITNFGREACAHPSVPIEIGSFEQAKARQRNAASSPFESRTKDRALRLEEQRDRDMTAAGRVALVERIVWAIYAGLGIAHQYEWAMVRSVRAMTSMADGADIAAGVRTTLNHALESIGVAHGGDADGWWDLSNGCRIVIEVTGNESEAQMSKELGPVVRHVRDQAKSHPGVFGLFIAPSIDLDLVSYMLVAAVGEPAEGVPSAVVVPFTERQIAALLVSGLVCDDLFSEAADMVRAAAKVRSRSSARELLASIDQLVSSAVAKV